MSSLEEIKREMERLDEQKNNMTDNEYLEKSNALLKSYRRLKTFRIMECYASSITSYSNGRVLVHSRVGERYIEVSNMRDDDI